MHEIDKLVIEITRASITVSEPQTDQQVTYCKDPAAPLLFVKDSLREIDASRAAFLAQAWRAAHDAARRIGWLSS
jgi:hypothetical protein